MSKDVEMVKFVSGLICVDVCIRKWDFYMNPLQIDSKQFSVSTYIPLSDKCKKNYHCRYQVDGSQNFGWYCCSMTHWYFSALHLILDFGFSASRKKALVEHTVAVVSVLLRNICRGPKLLTVIYESSRSIRAYKKTPILTFLQIWRSHFIRNWS
jgi:hypothetical protein